MVVSMRRGSLPQGTTYNTHGIPLPSMVRGGPESVLSLIYNQYTYKCKEGPCFQIIYRDIPRT